MASEALLQSQEIGEIAAALAAAQGEFEPAEKDREADIRSEKGAYKYKYADIASCLDAVRQPLAKNGLAVLQRTELEGPEILLRTDLIHKSGQWMASRFPLPIAEGTWARPQNVGSIITFFRRYTLCAMLQIATEDDDGNAAMPPPPTRREDDRRPRRDDRRERRPAAITETIGEKIRAVKTAEPLIDYEVWLVDYCERVNRHWLDSIVNVPKKPGAKVPAEIVTKYALNNHLLKSLDIPRDKEWTVNLRSGKFAWETDREAMVGEAKVYCKWTFEDELAKAKLKPSREPGADDMPTADEEAILDRMEGDGKAVGNA